MEAQPNPTPEPAHLFLSPEVIELHLQLNKPVQPGLAKLIWTLNQLFRESDEAPDGR